MIGNGVAAPAESLTEVLALDHRRLKELLTEAKQALHAGDSARAFARFAEFRDGLERHITAEEDVLFPAFEALTGISAGGPTSVMRMEHREIRKLMAEIASALEHGDGNGHAMAMAALTARLYAHDGKEERIVYPATDRAARDADALQALLHRIKASAF